MRATTFQTSRSSLPSSFERRLNAWFPARSESKQTAHPVSAHARAVASPALKAHGAECFLHLCLALVGLETVQAMPLPPVASTAQPWQWVMETEPRPPLCVVPA